MAEVTKFITVKLAIPKKNNIMKKILLLALMVISIAACNSKGNQTNNDGQTESATTPSDAPANLDNSTSEPAAELYSCPMHPDVKGKKDDECPKCGMALTEKVE